MVSKIDNIMVALDNMGKLQIENFLKAEGSNFTHLKVGLELFCRYGRDFIEKLYQEHQKKIFLDLKLHDIPNTVAKAVNSLEGLPISFLTIHLSGGQKMIEAAIEQAKTSLPNTKILGVSYLTSLDSNDFKAIWGTPEDEIKIAFERLVQLAYKTKIDGIVCSAHELAIIKGLEKTNEEQLLTVCPGIRFADELDNGTLQDQKRVMTPDSAFNHGADYLVMGRSLTMAKNLKARYNFLKNIN